MKLLNELNLKNFRNLKEKNILFFDDLTHIIWENWKWKTNILEAISLLTWNDLLWIDFHQLVNKDEDIFFISANIDWINISISFDKEKNKKSYIIEWKKTSKNKFDQQTSKSVIFHPIFMNLMYQSPSQRRDYIDSLLSNTFNWYKTLLNLYKKTLKSRNKILKNIQDWKSNKEELFFWDNEFIKYSIEIYKYRYYLSNYIKENINTFKKLYLWKISNIDFIYNSKVDIKDIEWTMKNYLKDNYQKDLILWTTRIWPHVDDFDIKIDNISIKNFSSRWEMKSILIWLKLIEINFIERNTKQKPILLIDDLYSELDEKHKDIIMNYFKKYQTIITSITPLNKENNNTIII